MAPEQAGGQSGLIGPAADVYALGAILYECLTGRPPFKAATALDTLMQVVSDEPVHPRLLQPKTPRDLETVCLKCLHKAPHKRYASAEGLGDDLRRFLNGEPTHARPPSLFGLALRWLRRNAVTALCILAVGVLWGVSSGLVLEASPNRRLPLWPSDLTRPLGWVKLACESRTFWGSMFATTALLSLASGWVLTRVARPKEQRWAVGLAAVMGLIAALVFFLFVAPFPDNPQSPLYQHKPHPIDEELPWEQEGGWIKAALLGHQPAQGELEYLKQYLPPDKRGLDYPDWKRDVAQLREEAIRTNRLDRRFAALWLQVVVVLGFFVPLAMLSSWAVDYLDRSRGSRWHNCVLYVELYLPLGVLMEALMVTLCFGSLAPPWVNAGSRVPLMALVCWAVPVAALAAISYAAVTRRWAWFLRASAYLAWVVLAAATVWATAPFLS